MNIAAMKFAMRQRDINANEKLLLLCLCMHHSEITKTSSPTQERLVVDTSMSLSTVRRILKQLEDKKIISVVDKEGFVKGRGKSYNITKYKGYKMSDNKKMLEDEMFKNFYEELYPKGRRVKRPEAKKAWDAIENKQKVYPLIVADLHFRMTRGVWRDLFESKELNFISHPSVYLRNEMWMDDQLEGKHAEREKRNGIRTKADNDLLKIL